MTPDIGEYVAGGRVVSADRAPDWVAAGWELFKKQPGMWIALAVIAFAALFAPAFIPIIGSLLYDLLRPVFGAGMLVAARNVDEGHELQVEHLFAGFKKKLAPLAIVGAITLIAKVPCSLLAAQITGLSVLAVLFGYGVESDDLHTTLRLLFALLITAVLMIPVMLAAKFAPALVMFHDRPVGAAMRESLSGCAKNIVPLIVYFMITMVLVVIASLPCGLGLLVLGPVLGSAHYVSYKDIYLGAERESSPVQPDVDG